jgi:vitamin B12 transporter
MNVAIFGGVLHNKRRELSLSARTVLGAASIVVLSLFLQLPSACADEDDLRSLELYNGPGLEVVSADRSPRPASQTAENITVVTSKDIEALNAHTLADILYNVTGVELEMRRTPGSTANISLQGSAFNHILVLIDNVPINNLSNNYPDIGSIPVQMIERVEVVKGAASSSWGNALGGIINIITKSPTPDPFSGTASVSIGERTTLDGRGEASGTLNRFGYYLTGGKLRSNGLLPNNATNLNNVYGKLRYDLPVQGWIALTAGFIDNDSGQLQAQRMGRTFNFNEDVNQFVGTLSAQYPLTERLTFDGSVRSRQATFRLQTVNFADNSVVAGTSDDESTIGATARLSWVDNLQNFVSGIDYDHVKAHLTQPQTQVGADLLNSSAERVGVYLNDTFTLARFALTPSARFDHTERGDLFSPSFGITYALTDNTVLRGYTARGYSLISLNRSNSVERVWTSQLGFETADIPFVWVKGTVFRNDTWNIDYQFANTDGTVGVQKKSQLKQGVELEARTLPWYGTSLSLGYTFIDATDSDTEAVLHGVARHTVDVGLKYEDSRYLRGLLIGHYVDWNNSSDAERGYHDVIWDLHLGKKITLGEGRWVEIFGSIRNLFNGYQNSGIYKSINRWTEVGVRCAF